MAAIQVAGRPTRLYRWCTIVARRHRAGVTDLQFRILGPLDVRSSGRSVEVGGLKRRGVLALMLLHRGQPLSRERIVEELWGDSSNGAAATVQTYMSQLRKLLAVDPELRIETVAGGYRLVVPRHALDATRFEDTARAAAAESGIDARYALLQSALAEWSGVALADFRGASWADDAATRFELQRLEVLEQRIEADLAMGRSGALVPELESLVRQHPLSERMCEYRMLALYRSGRHADALRAYGELRTQFAEELGIDPSPALAELERRILDHDPTLATEAAVVRTVPVASGAPALSAVDPSNLPTGTVTFLLTDIVGSTELWDDRPEAMARAVKAHEDLIERAVTEHDGTFLKHRGEGDSTLSVFARAADAAAAAIAMRGALAERAPAPELGVSVRIALHTGEADERDGDYFGPALNRAARIRALAGANEILCSRGTADLIVDTLAPDVALIELGALRLRGLRRTEVVFRIVLRDGSDLPPLRAGGHAEPDAHSREKSVRVDLCDDPTLISREAELDRLADALAAARDGRPQVIFVRGDAGVGKTRLVHDFVDRGAGDTELHVITCSPHGASARVALVDLVRRGDSRANAGEDAVLALTRPTAEHEDASRLRALTTLRDAVRTLADARPAILLIEDMHWADPGFLELIEFLVQDLAVSRRGPRLLVIATRRTFGVSIGVEATLARLERQPGTRTMTLRPLREVDVDELVRSYGIDAPGRHLVRLLYERSRGNPLYVREALRRIADLDGFVRRSGYIESRVPPTEFGAPADLQELVERRFSDLPPELVDLLSLAAIAGFEFDPALLDEVAAMRTAPLLGAAIRAGLIAETSGGYRFTHPIIHAAGYDAMAPDQRRLTHRMLAAALDRLPEDRRQERLLELAHHVLEGGVDAVPPHVARDLWGAGRQASALAEWGLAVRCYDAAIEIAQGADADATSVAWMYLFAGRAHEHNYEAVTATRMYEKALAQGREHGDIVLWGRSALALSMRAGVSRADSITGDMDMTGLVDALAHVDAQHPKLRAQILRHYAETRFTALDTDEGLRCATEAVALARETGDAMLLLRCESTLAFGHLFRGDAPAARALLADVRERIGPDTEVQTEGFSLARLTIAELALGLLDDALKTAHDAFVAFDARRHHAGASLAATLSADIHLRLGDRAEGEARAQEAARLYRISEYAFVPAGLYGALVVARSLDGDYEGAQQALDDWRATGQRGQRLARVVLAVHRGDLDEAAALLDGSPRLVDAACVPSMLQTAMLGALSEIAAALGRADVAERVLTALDTRISTAVVYAPGMPYHAARGRAMALRTVGRADPEADRLAIAALERAGARPELDRARQDFARLDGPDASS